MTKTTEDKRLKEVKKVIEEWDTYPKETQIALESAISMARILTMIRDNEKAGQEVRKLIYVSERILNIQDLEKEIKNAALHFDILKKELKKTAPSSEIVDAAVYQISQSLEKANDFEFCLEQRKCEIKDAYENPRFAGNHQDAGNAD